MHSLYERIGKFLDVTDDTDLEVYLYKGQYDAATFDYLISISDALDANMSIPDNQPDIDSVKGMYRHYKNKDYDLFGVGFHLERRVWMAVYSPDDKVPDIAKICVRKWDDFFGLRQGEPRFKKL